MVVPCSDSHDCLYKGSSPGIQRHLERLENQETKVRVGKFSSDPDNSASPMDMMADLKNPAVWPSKEAVFPSMLALGYPEHESALAVVRLDLPQHVPLRAAELVPSQLEWP